MLLDGATIAGLEMTVELKYITKSLSSVYF